MNNITTIQLIGDVQGYLDLDESTIVPLTFALADIRDISSRTGSFSKSIKIKGTKNNNKLLNHYYDINIDAGTFDINVKQKCIIIQNGVVIFDNALMQLISVNKIEDGNNYDEQVEYTILIKDTTSDFFTIISNKYLDELDLKIPTHILNSTTVGNSFNNTYLDGFKYNLSYNPEIPKGANGYDDTVYLINEFKPGIFVRKYFDRIFNSATGTTSDGGYRYSFPDANIDTIQFDKLFIPYNGDDKLSDDESLINYFTSVSANTNQIITNDYKTINSRQYIKSIPFTKINIPVEISDVNNLFNTTTSTYTTPSTPSTKNTTEIVFDIAFRIYVDNPTSGDLKLTGVDSIKLKPILYFNGVSLPLLDYVPTIANNTVYSAGQTTIVTVNTTNKTFRQLDNLTPNDSMEFDIYSEIYQLNNRPIDLNKPLGFYNDNNEYVTTGKFKIEVISFAARINTALNADYGYGATIDLNKFIPKKIKQSDFIKGVLGLFNLYAEVDKNDSKLINIYRRDSFYDNGTLVDWTEKLVKDEEKELTFLPLLTNKKLVLTYKQDKDIANETYFKATNEVYGQQEFIYDNDYVKEIETKEFIFSPTPMYMTSFSAITPMIIGAAPNTNIRILLDGGNFPCNKFDILDYVENGNKIQNSFTSYPHVSHWDKPSNPNFDLNFGVCDFYFRTDDYGNNTINTLFNLHWRRTVQQINNGKMLTANFVLNEMDIASMRLSDKILVNNSYWNINKIIDYDANSNKPTKVELISIDDTLSPLSVRNIKKVRSSDSVRNDVITYLGGVRNGYVNTIGNPSDVFIRGGGVNNWLSDDIEWGEIIGNDNIVKTLGSIRINGSNNDVWGSGIVWGDLNGIEVDGDAFVFGGLNAIRGTNPFVVGNINDILSDNPFIFGSSNIIRGTNPFVFGGFNDVDAEVPFVFGANNLVRGTNPFVFGEFNAVDGEDIIVLGQNNTIPVGSTNTIVMGNSNYVSTGVTNSYVMGNNITATTSNALTINNLVLTPGGTINGIPFNNLLISGVPNYIPKFIGTGLTESNISDNGSFVNVNSLLKANSISATTYQNLPMDVYTTGFTFDTGNYDISIRRNDGTVITQNLGVLATEVTITGGTYNPSDGTVTFVDNSGGTFSVSGFTTGITDSYTVAATLNNETISFDNNVQGTNYYSVNLTPALSKYFPKTGGTLTGNLTLTGSVTANSFIKSGGTSSQFLKADGSVDNKVYITGYTETDTLQSVTNRGSATTTNIQAKAFIKSGGTSSQFLKADGSSDSNSYYLASNPSGFTSNLGTVTSVSALNIGTTGTDLNSSVVNSSTTPVITLNVPTASASNRGALSSTDWTTFNNKQNTLGYTPENVVNKAINLSSPDNTKYPTTLVVSDGLNLKVNTATTISTTSPLQGGGDLSANRTLSITQAGSGTNGYLSSTDWNTFNNKVSTATTINTTSPLQGGGNLSTNRTLSILTASTSVTGVLTSTDWTTFNNKQVALVSGTNIKTIEGQSLLGSGNIDLSKSDVGLGNVDNTSDVNKPISTATQAALDLKVSTGRTISTTAPLQGGGNLSGNRTLSITQAGSGTNGYLSSTDWNTFNNKVNTGRTISTTSPLQGGGDLSTNRTLSILTATTSVTGVLSNTDWNTFNSKQSALVSGTNIKTIEGQSILGSGNIDLSKTDVGLSNVDNTSDVNKPISTATQAALDLKVGTGRTISTTSPLQGGGNLSANRTFSILTANTTTTGALSSTDWNTFNNKQAALVSGTNIKTVNGNTLLGSGNVQIGDVFVTGGTYNQGNGIATFRNNTGGTFNVTGFSDTYVTGGTYSAGVTTFRNNTGGTFNISGYFSSYTETDTLQSVTTRGSATTTDIQANRFIKAGGTSSQFLLADGNVTTNVIGGAGTSTYFPTWDSSTTLTNSTLNDNGSSINFTNRNIYSTVTGNTNYLNVVGDGDGNAYASLSLSDTANQSIWQFTDFVDKSFGFSHNNGTSWSFPLFVKSNGNVVLNSFGDTGELLQVNGTAKVTSTLTANSFVKAGGTSSQFLLADGNVTTNVIGGSGTSGYIPKWSSTSGLTNSTLNDNGSSINFTNRNIYSTVTGNTNYLNVVGDGDGNAYGSLSLSDTSNQSIWQFTNFVDKSFGFSHNNGTSWSFPLFVKSNGNVVLNSFGDTGEKLQVNGTAKVSSTLTAGSIVKAGGTSSQFLLADGNVTTNVIGGAGTSNYIPKFTGGTAIGISQIQDNGTNVGIGTTTGTAKVEIFTADNSAGFRVKSPSGNFRINPYITSGYGSVLESYTPTESAYQPLSFAGSKFSFITGNVLIDSPIDNGVDKLQINGTVISTGFKKNGGTSSQFLKADGSVDSNTYAVKSYKVYTATISDASTTIYVTELENTLGASINWYFDGTDGVYNVIASSGVFENNKVFISTTFNPQATSYAMEFQGRRVDNNTLIFTALDMQNNTPRKYQLSGCFVEIRVYN